MKAKLIFKKLKSGFKKLVSLLSPGKKAMKVMDFLNGRADWFQPGQMLTNADGQS
mgnify:CR=1 FL=1